MAPPKQEDLESNDVFDRMNGRGQMIRYDQKLNLMGLLDIRSGNIITFFRPGFQHGGPYTPVLEPSIYGALVFRDFVSRKGKYAP